MGVYGIGKCMGTVSYGLKYVVISQCCAIKNLCYIKKMLVSKRSLDMEKKSLKLGDPTKMQDASKNFTQIVKPPISKKISDFLKEQGQKEKRQSEKQSAVSKLEKDTDL
jgi:pyruvate/2-oxoacid:ferredoxin oxidoreductase beta subunit